MERELHLYEKRPTRTKRDLGQKRVLKTRDIHMWNETYIGGKRPISVEKDTHI